MRVSSLRTKLPAVFAKKMVASFANTMHQQIPKHHHQSPTQKTREGSQKAEAKAEKIQKQKSRKAIPSQSP